MRKFVYIFLALVTLGAAANAVSGETGGRLVSAGVALAGFGFFGWKLNKLRARPSVIKATLLTSSELKAKRARTAAKIAAQAAELYDLGREPKFYSCIEDGKRVTSHINGEKWFNKLRDEWIEVGSKGYVWQTTGKEHACPRCQANHGKRFVWSSPPPGGHPKCSPGCHCNAIPFMK